MLAWIFFGAAPAAAQSSAWNAAGGGGWLVEGNWNAGVPNSVGAQAIFGPSLPNRNAMVQVSAPVTVGLLRAASPFTLTLRDEPITFDNGGMGAALYVDFGAGDVTFNAPLVLNDDLQLLVDETAGSLVLARAISGSGDISMSLGGSVAFSQDNSAWSGALNVNGGQVIASHSAALGTVDVGTVVNAGTLRLDAATAEPIEVRGGALTVRQSPQHVTLNGGALRMEVDRPLTFLDAASQGGEIQLLVEQFSSPLVIPSGSPTSSPFTVIGVAGSGRPFQGRVISGGLAIAGPSADNLLRLGSRDEILTVDVPLLRANNIGAVEFTEGFFELTRSGDYPGQTIVSAGATVSAIDPTSLGLSSGSEADATIVRTGGTLSLSSGAAVSELIILEGGRFSGVGKRDILIRDRGVVRVGKTWARSLEPASWLLSGVICNRHWLSPGKS